MESKSWIFPLADSCSCKSYEANQERHIWSERSPSSSIAPSFCSRKLPSYARLRQGHNPNMFDSFAFPHGFMSPFFFPYSPMTHNSPLPHAHWLKYLTLSSLPLCPSSSQQSIIIMNKGLHKSEVVDVPPYVCYLFNAANVEAGRALICALHTEKKWSHSLYNLQLTKRTTAEGEMSKRQTETNTVLHCT